MFLSLKLKEIQIVEDKKKKLTHKEKMKLSRTDRKVNLSIRSEFTKWRLFIEHFFGVSKRN